MLESERMTCETAHVRNHTFTEAAIETSTVTGNRPNTHHKTGFPIEPVAGCLHSFMITRGCPAVFFSGKRNTARPDTSWQQAAL